MMPHVPDSKSEPRQARPTDGPQPHGRAVLPALRQLLQDSLVGTPLQPLAQHIADRLPGATLLPADQRARTEMVRQALTWLVDHLDQPLVPVRCAELGPAVNLPAQRLETLSAVLLDALRANVNPWRPEYEAAWRSTITLVVRWLADGAKAHAYEPVFWVGVVVGGEPGTHVRTYLPYPGQPGQYAVVEVEPGDWRECPILGTTDDNVVALHLPAPRQLGERLKLRGAGGGT